MCTAISFLNQGHYFGRNLDLEYRYKEIVTIFPRKLPLKLRFKPTLNNHYAMIGMATVDKQYPLFYEATNEYGLSMAGLSYPQNACYLTPQKTAENIAPFELIPLVLGRCKNLDEGLSLLKNVTIVSNAYSSSYPTTPLHWLLADAQRAIAIEPESDGLKLRENPIGVLTNSPGLDYQLLNLENYLHLTNSAPVNDLCSQLSIGPYSHGLGSFGLPGDLSSMSRFVRAAFTKQMSQSETSEEANVSQFFHILDSVAQVNGCVKVGNSFEKTQYSCCCNTRTGTYYYTTYDNRQITAVSMKNFDLNGDKLITFPLIAQQQIHHLQ